jgi:predicted Rossmann-fold nucleotide-binding protein
MVQEELEKLKARLKKGNLPFRLISDRDPDHIELEFPGTYQGRDVIWHARVIRLPRPEPPQTECQQYIDITDNNGVTVPIQIGLCVAELDTPALRKTVIMVQNFKRLQPGRHRFSVPLPPAAEPPPAPSLKFLRSGGQTGVDRAALDAALACGIPCGGKCPKGRLAEDGVIPARYPLKETVSDSYAVRTEANVREADATLILTRGPLTGGTALTYRLAQKYKRPCLVIDLAQSWRNDTVLAWLARHQVKELNVAGPRESQQPGIYRQAREALKEILCP